MAKMAKWRRHPIEFKRQAVERMKTCENIEALARELQVERKLLYTWKYQFEGRPEPPNANLRISPEERKDARLREENSKLKAIVADQALQIDFFRGALLKIKETRQQNTAPGGTASTKSSVRERNSKAR